MLVPWCKWLRCIHLLVTDDCLFPKSVERLDTCELSSPVTEATD